MPLLGGIVSMLGTLHEVYETIGWTDPAYHSIRSPEERLEEARRVGAIGNQGSAQPSNGEDSLRGLHAGKREAREGDSSPREG